MSIRNCAGLFSWARGVVAALFRVRMHARAHHHFALGTPGACLLPPQLSWKITMYNIHEHCVYMEEAEHRAQCIAKLFLLSVRQPLGGVRQFHVFNKQYACALQCTGIDMDQEERLSARACVGGDSHARSRCSCRLGLYHYHADQSSSASTLTWSPRISGRAPSSAPPRWP